LLGAVRSRGLETLSARPTFSLKSFGRMINLDRYAGEGRGCRRD
jgi:hypothetical protein